MKPTKMYMKSKKIKETLLLLTFLKMWINFHTYLQKITLQVIFLDIYVHLKLGGRFHGRPYTPLSGSTTQRRRNDTSIVGGRVRNASSRRTKNSVSSFLWSPPGIRYPVRKKNISVCIVLTCIVCMYMYMAKYGFVFRHPSLIYFTLAMSSYFICRNML